MWHRQDCSLPQRDLLTSNVFKVWEKCPLLSFWLFQSISEFPRTASSDPSRKSCLYIFAFGCVSGPEGQTHTASEWWREQETQIPPAKGKSWSLAQNAKICFARRCILVYWAEGGCRNRYLSRCFVGFPPSEAAGVWREAPCSFTVRGCCQEPMFHWCYSGFFFF